MLPRYKVSKCPSHSYNNVLYGALQDATLFLSCEDICLAPQVGLSVWRWSI